jgi:hypothetical protein
LKITRFILLLLGVLLATPNIAFSGKKALRPVVIVAPPPPPNEASGWTRRAHDCVQENGTLLVEEFWSMHDDDFRTHTISLVNGEPVRVLLQTTFNVIAVTNTIVYIKQTDGKWGRYDSARNELDLAERDLIKILHERNVSRDAFTQCRSMK